jgi:Na+/citrate or Na+/malate symporter
VCIFSLSMYNCVRISVHASAGQMFNAVSSSFLHSLLAGTGIGDIKKLVLFLYFYFMINKLYRYYSFDNITIFISLITEEFLAVQILESFLFL